MADTRVKIAGVELKNPVTTASGTFGFGKEYSQFVDINKIGAVSVKGITNEEWKGNPAPRIAETYGGVLNSVGLQNPGVDMVINKELPFLRMYDTKIIANICGNTISEYEEVSEKIDSADVDLVELNISCPNISAGGLSFGTDLKSVENIVSSVRKKLKNKPLIVKLTPNVTDIAQIAKAAEASGADAISLINTLLAMKIDIYKRKPALPKKMAGLSGPAIKPVAVRMVYQVAKAVKIPIIGMGGIMNGEDAIEFMMAGATAVAVGTANFVNPKACEDILRGLEEFLDSQGIKNVNDIIGIIE